MLQIVLERPGHFSAMEGPSPTPLPGEALVRVHRVGICGTDLHAFAGDQPFFTYPRILGHELGVEVLDPGDDPGGLKAGDRCSVEPYLNCGACPACRRGKPNCCSDLRVLGVHVDGGMRSLLTVPARKLHTSATLDYEQLALVETLGIGAHAVERAGAGPDDFVLIVGAGPIGLSAIPFVLAAGAKLAVMDISEPRLAFCRDRLGVGNTLGPGPEAIARLKAVGGELPTVVIDATGNPKSMAGAFDLAGQGGRIVFVGLFQGDVSFNDPNFHRRELTLCASRNSRPADFRKIIAMIESGRVTTQPWITHRLKLAATPEVFPREIAGNPAVLKAMIEV